MMTECLLLGKLFFGITVFGLRFVFLLDFQDLILKLSKTDKSATY